MTSRGRALALACLRSALDRLHAEVDAGDASESIHEAGSEITKALELLGVDPLEVQQRALFPTRTG